MSESSSRDCSRRRRPGQAWAVPAEAAAPLRGELGAAGRREQFWRELRSSWRTTRRTADATLHGAEHGHPVPSWSSSTMQCASSIRVPFLPTYLVSQGWANFQRLIVQPFGEFHFPSLFQAGPPFFCGGWRPGPLVGTPLDGEFWLSLGEAFSRAGRK